MIKLNKYHEQIAYLFFGVVTTLVSWGVFAFLMALNVPLVISNTISWVAAIVVAFFTNKWWVFKSTVKGLGAVLKEGFVFLESRILTGILEIGLVPLLVYLGFDGLVFRTAGFDARILVSVIVVVGNYFLGKFWVFKNRRSEEEKRKE